MRLIDADTAFGVLADYYHHRMPIQYMALKEALDRVPTVEAVPERKNGRWVRKKDEKINAWWWECSECGKYPLKSLFKRQDDLSEYCPHCGAHMEGAEDGV